MSAMKCAVWGAGAIGGVVGAGIAAAGEDVLLVDVVPEYVRAMNESGLVIRTAGEDERVRVRAALPEATFDLVFLAVKSQYTQAALDAIEPHVHARGSPASPRVAAAEGVEVAAFAHFDPAPFVDRSPAGRDAAFHILDEIARGQAAGNTKIRTGYWRDIVVRKRRTEIDYITGEIVRCGERHGIPTPLNRLQWRMFDEIESGTRPMRWENLDELDAALDTIRP